MERPIAYRGRMYTIAFAVDKNGRSPGQEFFEALEPPDKAKLMKLFQLLGDYGEIKNPEKFGSLKQGLFEFKSFQIRMPFSYLPGSVVLITHGFRKKRDRTPREEIERAKNILREDHERARHAAARASRYE